MSNTTNQAQPNLTDNERRTLASLWEAAESNGQDFGFSDDVDFRALGLTAQGFAATFGSLDRKGAFEWTEPGAEANGKALSGTQYQLSEWAQDMFSAAQTTPRVLALNFAGWSMQDTEAEAIADHAKVTGGLQQCLRLYEIPAGKEAFICPDTGVRLDDEGGDWVLPYKKLNDGESGEQTA